MLRQGIREAARGVAQVTRRASTVTDLLQADQPPPAPAKRPVSHPISPTLPDIVLAGPTSRTVNIDELLARAAEGALESRLEAVRALARTSVRATVTPGLRASSWLGGEPFLGGAPWPQLGEEPMPFLARLELPRGVDGSADGSIAVFVSRDGSGAEGRAPRTGVLLLPSDGEAADADEHETRNAPLGMSRELQLPRAWSRPVHDLGLSEGEREAWEELRGWLAEAQGVTTFDRERGVLGLHRLLGFPDERSGNLPLLCEMQAAGVHGLKQSPRSHPDWHRHEEGAKRWRLLLQLTRDPATARHFRDNETRLYVLAPAADLEAGDFSRVQAVFR